MDFTSFLKENPNVCCLVSNHCIVCKKESAHRQLLAMKIQESDKDLLPFEALGLPVCILCSKVYKHCSYEFLLNNLLDLCEHGLCQIAEAPTNARPS